ncbi:hypothetical protein VNO77_02827 [Canavalia gladiata]|uniref:Uncharacterized protein n=1 Tax=Canavalia gladiata TaxID=3824 RepID=A0AAN9R695_CANGL
MKLRHRRSLLRGRRLLLVRALVTDQARPEANRPSIVSFLADWNTELGSVLGVRSGVSPEESNASSLVLSSKLPEFRGYP